MAIETSHKQIINVMMGILYLAMAAHLNAKFKMALHASTIQSILLIYAR